MTSHRRLGIAPSAAGVVQRAIRALNRSWLLATVGLVIVGVTVNFDLLTSDHLGPLARNSEVAAGEGAGMGISTDDFDSFSVVGYAGTDLALIEARVIPNNRSGRPILVAELGVRNNSAVQTRLPLMMVNLEGPHGMVTGLDRFEFTEFATRLVVEPGRSTRALAVFKLGVNASLDLSDYQLRIGEQGRWPVYLPLDGPIPPPVYPRPLEVTFVEPQARYRELTVSLTEAVTALEYGVYRAAVGQHLAIVTVTVTGSPAGSSTTIERDLWTLVDGDARRRAIGAVPGLRAVDANSVTMELVFGYSTESSDLDLMVGPAEERLTVARFKTQAFE